MTVYSSRHQYFVIYSLLSVYFFLLFWLCSSNGLTMIGHWCKSVHSSSVWAWQVLQALPVWVMCWDQDLLWQLRTQWLREWTSSSCSFIDWTLSVKVSGICNIPKSLLIHLITCTTWCKSEKCSSFGTSWFWSTIYFLRFHCGNGKGSASLVYRTNHLHYVLDFRNITTIITMALRRWYWLSWLSTMLNRLMKWEFKLEWIRLDSQRGFTVWKVI